MNLSAPNHASARMGETPRPHSQLCNLLERLASLRSPFLPWETGRAERYSSCIFLFSSDVGMRRLGT